jgi:hypothetical protein
MKPAYPLPFLIKQLWLKIILRCEAWSYRIAFDDPEHQGQEFFIFEGQISAKDEEHAIAIQTQLTQIISGQLHARFYSQQGEAKWLGFRHGDETRSSFWAIRSAVGLRGIKNSISKGWNPGGLRPGLLLQQIFDSLSEHVVDQVNQEQQTKSNEQIMVRFSLLLMISVLISFGTGIILLLSIINGTPLSWGVIYAYFFLVVTFGVLSVVVAKQLSTLITLVKKRD